jgi:hypothetical protein
MLHFQKTSATPLTAPLRLRLSGFSQYCQAASVSEVLAVIDQLPGFHLSGLREIEYLNAGESEEYLLPQGLSAWRGRKAEFTLRERKILIFNIQDRELLFHVLLHEIGHFVYFLIISSTLKHYWVSQVFPGTPSITSYGTTDAAEDFAETYAAYVLAPETLAMIPAKFSFMHHLVFSGAPITLKEKACPNAL